MIEDLRYHFDTHAITGVKMNSLMSQSGREGCVNYSSSSSSSASPSPTPSSSPERSSSPPGFPAEPKYPPPPPHNYGPTLIGNLNMLDQMFGGADTKNNVAEERKTLEDYDEGGTEDQDQPQFTYVTSKDNHYSTGHGRRKCRFDVCSINWEVPENCGFAADNWQWPNDFRPCSQACRGAFCQCINGYKM